MLSLPPFLRVAALGDAILGCSEDEAGALGPPLLELAAVQLFGAEGRSVRLLRSLGLDRLLDRARGRTALRQAALVQVARVFQRLPRDQQRAACAIGLGRWAQAVGPLATDPNPRVRRSLAYLIGAGGLLDLAPLAGSLLLDADPVVADEAERALVVLASGVTDLAEPRPDAAGAALVPVHGDPGVFIAALADGLQSFSEHRRRGVVVAAIACGSPAVLRGAGPASQALRAALTAGHSEVAGAVRTVLGVTRLPGAARRAWEWSAWPAYRETAARRLAGIDSAPAWNDLWSAGHLGARPARRQVLRDALARSPRGPGPWPTPGTLDQLDLPARRGLTRAWRLSWHKPGDESIAAIIRDSDVVARLSAAAALTPGMAPDLCFDNDERVASIAASRVLGQDWPGRARVASLLLRSPHARVRAIAKRCADAGVDPAELREVLRQRLVVRDSAARLGVLRAIRQARLAPTFAADVLGLVKEPWDGTPAHARVLATAVAVLGDSGRPELVSSVQTFLNHPDARVRANTVDALTHRGRTVPAQAGILELKHDPHHRVRANVVRAILGPGGVGGPGELIRLLEDDRAEHRLAGAWLASKVPLGPKADELHARLVAISDHDPDPRVRARARMVRDRFDVAWRWRALETAGSEP